jgi:hypothetical protein
VSKEIYIMPLWRFKTGDFATSVETILGLRPKIVTAEGIAERPTSSSWFQRWRARREVRAIRRAVERVNTGRLEWKDDGPVVYTQQTLGMEAVRAYARWLDCREQLGRFEPVPSQNYYEHPVWKAPLDRPLTCPHLVDHDCYNGYYLPCDFDRVVQVEPYRIYGTWPATRSVGSSVRLVRELLAVQEHLGVGPDYEFPQDDSLLPVKQAFLQLREVAELSCRHGLPIIFWS